MGKSIVLVDDHKILRDGLRSLLETHLGHQVVGEAESGRMAISLVNKLKPELVIMDLTMPDMNGIEATRQILKGLPKTKIIALSMHSDKRFVADMLSAGASAYLLKDCAFEELGHAIDAVTSGRTYVSPNLHGILVDDYVRKLQGKYDDDEMQLTKKERQILTLLASGKTAKEIADQLGLSSKTIDTHRHRIMQKLDTKSVAELVRYAIRHGLVKLGD